MPHEADTTEVTRPDRRSDTAGEPQGERWQGRPVVAGLLRLLVLALPVACAVVASLLFERAWHRPHATGGAVVWWAATVAVATGTATLVERLARRLLPLAALLRMTLLFPDLAPSRFKVARSAASPRRLQELAAADGDERSTSAAQVLALLTQLSRHDRHTRGHSERVKVFSDLIAEQLGVEGLDRDKLRWGSLLHDIGKISVPAVILNKPGRPSAAEWAILQGHPEAGERLAGPLFDWLGEWAGGITEHHERYDGAGYPHGLSGDRLTLAGRIVAVADSYETMTAARAYKKPMAVAAARQELAECAGKQFDPTVVRAFLLVGLSKTSRALGLWSWLVHLPFATRLETVGLHTMANVGSTLSGPVVGLGVGAVAVAAVAGAGVPASAAQPTVLSAQHSSAPTQPGPQHARPSSAGAGHAAATGTPSPALPGHGDHAAAHLVGTPAPPVGPASSRSSGTPAPTTLASSRPSPGRPRPALMAPAQAIGPADTRSGTHAARPVTPPPSAGARAAVTGRPAAPAAKPAPRTSAPSLGTPPPSPGTPPASPGTPPAPAPTAAVAPAATTPPPADSPTPTPKGDGKGKGGGKEGDAGQG